MNFKLNGQLKQPLPSLKPLNLPGIKNTILFRLETMNVRGFPVPEVRNGV